MYPVHKCKCVLYSVRAEECSRIEGAMRYTVTRENTAVQLATVKRQITAVQRAYSSIDGGVKTKSWPRTVLRTSGKCRSILYSVPAGGRQTTSWPCTVLMASEKMQKYPVLRTSGRVQPYRGRPSAPPSNERIQQYNERNSRNEREQGAQAHTTISGNSSTLRIRTSIGSEGA